MESVPENLRAATQALSFHAWRHKGRAVALRSLMANKPPAAPADALLCLALGLLSDPDQTSYDTFTLVNQTVEAAKRSAKTKQQAHFINACLRRFLREAPNLLATVAVRAEARWNHPLWWIKQIQKDHPQQWERILTAANRHPPMTVRVNVRKMEPVAYQQALDAAGIQVLRASGSLMELAQPVPVHSLPGFAQGWVSVQDGAAQMAAHLLLRDTAQVSRPRVLDACAAPGGKTAHILELVDADVTALELDPLRARRIEQTLSRLELKAHVLCADAADVGRWWDERLFDLILLDAPCTASGINRRHPDVRWLRRPGDIEQLAAEQRRILSALWPTLRKGGRLLYCTCSVFKAEGDEQVTAFLENNTDARLLASPGHLIPAASSAEAVLADNHPGDHDGFFYALFEKTAD
jgi:16S rRNA (cytosine967-C5)-methyltransferase